MFTVQENVQMLKATGGKLVVYGAAETFAHLDIREETFDPSQGSMPIAGTEHMLTFATGTLPGIAEGAEITHDGNAYALIESPMRVDDGGLSRARVKPV